MIIHGFFTLPFYKRTTMHKNRIPAIVIKCVCFDNLYFHLEQLALAQDVIIVKLNESWTWHIDEVRFINQPVFFTMG